MQITRGSLRKVCPRVEKWRNLVEKVPREKKKKIMDVNCENKSKIKSRPEGLVIVRLFYM